jgi:inner membrane protein involved in colicin E2 resistance
MGEQFWIAALLLGAFVLYVSVKVVAYMRKSEQDWQQVDKTKLREWDDDEE